MAESDSKPYGVIYLVTNTVTGKVYIGQTTRSIEQRWGQHCYYADSRRLGPSIRKHGKDAFVVEKIAEARSKQELDDLEIFHIQRLDSTNRNVGYNLALGGGSGKHSEDTKKMMSEKTMGHHVSDETRKKISASQIGRRPTEQTREKLSAAKLGVKHTPERVAKVVSALTGKTATAAAKKSLSAARTKLWQDPKARENMRQASIAARSSTEYVDRVSENTKTQWQDPAQREKLKAAQAAGKAKFWADPIKRAARIEKRRLTIAAKMAAQI